MAASKLHIPLKGEYPHLSRSDQAVIDSLHIRLRPLYGTIADINDDSALKSHFNIIEFFAQNEIELNILTERADILVAIWVEFFKFLEAYGGLKFKYNSRAEFVGTYPRFESYPSEEIDVLMRTANWIRM